MSCLIQQGFGKGKKLESLLGGIGIDGCILSPFDERPEVLSRTARLVRDNGGIVLLDPQTFVDSIDRARPGKRPDYGLVIPSIITASASTVVRALERIVELNLELHTDKIISPTVIQHSFQDPNTGVALQMASSMAQLVPGRSIASVVIDEDALSNWTAAQAWLNSVTRISGLTGIYLVVSRRIVGPYPYAWSPDRLSLLLRLIYWLEQNGLAVTLGYSEADGILAKSVGASAMASGWSVSRRILIEDRWKPQTGGAAPVVRLWIPELFTPMRRTEAMAIADNAAALRLLGDPRSILRIQQAASINQSQSHIDYLTDVAMQSVSFENQPDALSLAIEEAIDKLQGLRRLIPELEANYLNRLRALHASLNQFLSGGGRGRA